MEDIPQPPNSPYSIGETVKIHLSDDDPDAEYNDTVCEIVDVLADDFDKHTNRSTDGFLYTVQEIGSNEVISITFRHRDLIPADTE